VKDVPVWIQIECGAISKDVFNILAKYGMNVSWNCDSCQVSMARLEERMNVCARTIR
jgi:hypothetical protein